MIVLVMPDHTSADEPALIRAAPISPPMRACDELVGSPSHQVMMSHRHAPTSVDMMRFSSMMPISMMPVPMVPAT